MSPARYDVFTGERLVLRITDAPGPLTSRFSPPPPAGEPVTAHPFLTASARAPELEGELRGLLDASTSTADFLDRLRAAGYTVGRVR